MIKLVDVEKTYFSKAGDIAALKKTNIEVKEGKYSVLSVCPVQENPR